MIQLIKSQSRRHLHSCCNSSDKNLINSIIRRIVCYSNRNRNLTSTSLSSSNSAFSTNDVSNSYSNKRSNDHIYRNSYYNISNSTHSRNSSNHSSSQNNHSSSQNNHSSSQNNHSSSQNNHSSSQNNHSSNENNHSIGSNSKHNSTFSSNSRRNENNINRNTNYNSCNDDNDKDLGNFDGAIQVRDATHEDFSSVMSIDKELYMGRDYLPHTYHRALGTPCSKAVVCHTHADHIIGYAAGHLADGEQTLVLSSGRVKRSYRGQGHTKRMLETIRNHFRLERNVHLKREVLVTKGQNLAMTKTAFHEEYDDVLKRALVNFLIPRGAHLERQTAVSTQSLNRSQSWTGKESITLLDFDEATVFLSQILTNSSPLRRELFNFTDFLITNWTPFAISPTNAVDILKTNDALLVSGINGRAPEMAFCYRNDALNETYLADNCKDDGNYGCITKPKNAGIISGAYFDQILFSKMRQFPDERDESGWTPKEKHDHSNTAASVPVLSAGNYFPCKLGLAYNLDLYFPDRPDIWEECNYFKDDLLKAVTKHFKFHIQQAMSQSFEKAIHLIVFISAEGEEYQGAIVSDVMNTELGLEPEKWDTKHLHLYRRSIL